MAKRILDPNPEKNEFGSTTLPVNMPMDKLILALFNFGNFNKKHL
jgi:hypothetical protein